MVLPSNKGSFHGMFMLEKSTSRFPVNIGMRITEIFDKPTSFDKIENRKSYHDYEFKTGDIPYRISISVDSKRKAFDVQFMRLGKPSKRDPKRLTSDVETIFNDMDISQTLSVLSHTFSALQNAFKERPNYKRIIFQADKDQPSRVRLYNRLVKTLADKFGGKAKVLNGQDYVEYEVTL